RSADPSWPSVVNPDGDGVGVSVRREVGARDGHVDRVRLVRTRTDPRDAVADAARGRCVAPDIAGGPGGRAQLVGDLVRVAAGAGHLARAFGAGVRRCQADVVRRGLRAVDGDRVVAVDV